MCHLKCLTPYGVHLSPKKLVKNHETTVPKSLKIVVLELLKLLKIVVLEVLGCPGWSWGVSWDQPRLQDGKTWENSGSLDPPLGPKGEAKFVKNRYDDVLEGLLSDKSHHLECFLNNIVWDVVFKAFQIEKSWFLRWSNHWKSLYILCVFFFCFSFLMKFEFSSIF